MKSIAFARYTLAFGMFTFGLVSLPMACNSIVGEPSNLYRPTGAACAYGWQCAERTCSADLSERGFCGACLDLRRLGESCDGSLLPCSRTASCVDGICQSTKNTAGEPCTMPGKGDSDDCDIEFFCAQNSDGMGVCTALPEFGEACGSGFQRCAGFGHCERGICTAPREGALGDSCDDRPCMKNLKCRWYDEGNTCEEPNVVPINDDCSGFIPNVDCEKGSSCRPSGGPVLHSGYYPMVCLANKLEGDECASSHCDDGLICEKLEGETIYSCHALRNEGGHCESVSACNSGLECRNGTCQTECQ